MLNRRRALAAVGASFVWSRAHAGEVGQGLRKLSAYSVTTGGAAALLFLGSSHTHDPRDPQIDDLEEQFAAFKPMVVLVEGGAWPIAADRTEAVSKYGEMGYACLLAQRAGLKAQDADPDFAAEISHVTAVHGAEAAKLHYVLRMLPQFRAEADANSLDAKMQKWLRAPVFDRVAEMRGVITTLTELEVACARLLPQVGDWRQIDWSSVETRAPLNMVAQTSLDFRDAHITRRLVAELLTNQRVLVVAGRAHLDAQRTRLPVALRSA